MRKSPDDFARTSAGELTHDELAALKRIWPAAYDAVFNLLKQIEAGTTSEATSMLDCPLAELIYEMRED